MHADDDISALASRIRAWGRELGFQGLGITDVDLSLAEERLQHWLADGCHGDMEWMSRHGTLRSRPASLEPGTCRVISVRMDYLPESADAWEQIATPEAAFVARYALGRDYHKLLRKRLQRLAERIRGSVGPFGYRVFVDSAPVMEKPLAEKAGIGWIGKHTVLINRSAGSWFFLGEIYTDLPLPVDPPAEGHCGTCSACMDVCPTGAITAPYRLDARKCIAYLTIEHKGAIPEPLRPLIGNRIFGCDDCQLVCPWNKFAQQTVEPDFAPRHSLDSTLLLTLFGWDEDTFLQRTAGSAIRRLGHDRWLRNLAVALGNGPRTPAVMEALAERRNHPNPMVREHVLWALERLAEKHPDAG